MNWTRWPCRGPQPLPRSVLVSAGLARDWRPLGGAELPTMIGVSQAMTTLAIRRYSGVARAAKPAPLCSRWRPLTRDEGRGLMAEYNLHQRDEDGVQSPPSSLWHGEEQKRDYCPFNRLRCWRRLARLSGWRSATVGNLSRLRQATWPDLARALTLNHVQRRGVIEPRGGRTYARRWSSPLAAETVCSTAVRNRHLGSPVKRSGIPTYQAEETSVSLLRGILISREDERSTAGVAFSWRVKTGRSVAVSGRGGDGRYVVKWAPEAA